MRAHLGLGILTLLAVFARPDVLWGQAFCSLRDPVRGVYELYPDATSYQSFVRRIDDRVRDEVSRTLDLELHFSELGQHTLYVAFRSGSPLGIVHVRSESTEWGLVEVAWALDLDLRVHDFRFQRCRAPECDALAAPSFRAELAGKDLGQLRQLLTDDTMRIEPARIAAPAGGADLAAALVRSAVKTIVVTRIAWDEDLRKVRRLVRASGQPVEQPAN